jgi:hypothetical protein
LKFLSFQQGYVLLAQKEIGESRNNTIGAFGTLPAGIAPMTYRRTSGLPPKTRRFHVLGFVTEARNQNDTMVLAILWVCGSHWRSIILVACFGNKLDFCRSQVRDSVDIFSVLDLHVSTWVTYSPQDSVQSSYCSY